jgi:Flp pilus assembly protein TadG
MLPISRILLISALKYRLDTSSTAGAAMRWQDFSNAYMRDTRGTIAMVFATSVFVLFGFVGFAVDASRAYSTSSRISSVLDSAALAGARLFENDTSSDAEIEATVKAYFQGHAAEKLLPGLKLTNLRVSIDRTNNKVSADVDIKLPTTFAQVIGYTDFTFNRSTQIAISMNKIELAMVLDITGSMNDNGKLPALKSAASDVIDSLMSGATSENSIRIAVAPFSASVNAGALANKVSASPAVTNCGYNWYWGYTCTTSAGADVDTCVIERTGSRAFTDDAPVGADILPAVPSTPYGNYTCPASVVVPLQSRGQVATIKSTINSYVATGATAGHIGAAWGWYLLSPKWSTVLPSASAPAAYGDKTVS